MQTSYVNGPTADNVAAAELVFPGRATKEEEESYGERRERYRKSGEVTG